MFIRSKVSTPTTNLLHSFYKSIVSHHPSIPLRSFSKNLSLKQEQQQDPRRQNNEPPKPPEWDKFVDAIRNAQQSIGNMVPMTFSTISDPGDGMRMWLYNFNLGVFKRVDKDFNEDEFLQGARQAFMTVRPLLIARDTEALKPMLTEKCYDKVSSFLHDYMEKNGMTLVGHIEQVKKVEIYNVRLRETDISENPTDINTFSGAMSNFLRMQAKPTRLDTVINVRYIVAESIAFLDPSGRVVIGHTDVKDRISVWSFERQSLNGDWRIRSFVK